MDNKDSFSEMRQKIKDLCASGRPVTIYDIPINGLGLDHSNIIDFIFLEFKESSDIVYARKLLAILISAPEDMLESNHIARFTLSYLGDINLTMREKLVLCKRVFEMCGPSEQSHMR